MKENNIFSVRFKELRNTNNLTQADLSNIFGITPTGISYWESGKAIPNFDMLKKISEYFDVSIDYLTGNEVKEENQNVLFRKLDKVDEKDKDFLLKLLNNTIDTFINNEEK